MSIVFGNVIFSLSLLYPSIFLRLNNKTVVSMGTHQKQKSCQKMGNLPPLSPLHFFVCVSQNRLCTQENTHPIIYFHGIIIYIDNTIY